MGIDRETKGNIKKNQLTGTAFPPTSYNENHTKKSFRGAYIYTEIL
jgi:hypothetical protein